LALPIEGCDMHRGYVKSGRIVYTALCEASYRSARTCDPVGDPYFSLLLRRSCC